MILLIVMFFGLLSIILLLWFARDNKRILQKHIEKIKTMERTISNHRFQIKKRAQALGLYNYQKYNLDDALLIQPEIIL